MLYECFKPRESGHYVLPLALISSHRFTAALHVTAINTSGGEWIVLVFLAGF